MAGSRRSGEMLPRMMASRSRAPTPARCMAQSDATRQRLESDSPGPAIRRSRMPVRSTIHWSEVSRNFSRSALVTTRSGTAVPRPVMAAIGVALTRAPRLRARRTRSRCGG